MRPPTITTPDQGSRAFGRAPKTGSVRRVGSMATDSLVESVRELQAEESDSPAVGRPDEIPLATQGVIAEMRRHLERQRRSGVPRTAY